MEGRIGQLDCNYRLIPHSASAFTNRLDRVAREVLGAACGQKLDGILGGDQAVWVVRRISVDLPFNAQVPWNDSQIASKWASRIVTAALREVTKGTDGRNVIRFDDQADLVTHFLTDLLRGEAWQKWYYGCFQRFRSQPTGAAALAALLENREHVAQVLARLAGSGLLEPLLSVLGPQALEQLWKTEWNDLPAGGEETALRPVFLAALNLASRSSSQGWATSVQMQRWLSEYSRSSFVAPDWRDRSGLALAVMAALEFLWTRGYLGSSIAEIAQSWKERETEAGNSLDWLDTDLLENALAGLARAEEETNERETALRPVFLAALSLVASSRRQGKPTGYDTLQWLNEGGIREYARSSFVPSDWTDRSQLVLAVISALEFLWKRGYLGLTIAEIGLAWREQEMQGGAEFGWLDRELLEQALTRWITAGGEANELPAADKGMLRPNLGTPRRRRFMADLAKAVALELRTLAKQRLDAPGCALRIYARLVAIDATWSSDPLAAQAIDGLLAAASWVAGSDLAWSGEIRFDAIGLDEIRAHGGTNQPLIDEVGTDGAQSELVHELRTSVRQRGWAALQSSAFLNKVLAGFNTQLAAEILRLCMLDALRVGSSAAAVLDASSQLLQRTSAATDANLRSPRPHSSTGPIALHVLRAAERPRMGSQVTAEFLRAFGDAGLDLILSVAAGAAAGAKDRLQQLAEGVECQCAGVFLMVRAMVDARLANTAEAAGYSLAPCILALGLCWGGEGAVFQGRLDTGVTLLAGQDATMTLQELQTMWRQVELESHGRFQANLLNVLAARGVVQGPSVSIHRLPVTGGRYAVVLGNGTVWPLGRVVRNADEEQAVVAAMMDAWREATQQEPVLEAAGEESMLALEQALEAIGSAHLDVPEADLTLGLAAISLLRLWAVWLRQFSASSVPYLLRNFIRRPGRIVKTTEGLVVELAPRPLDIVISMAGYLAPFEARPEPWGCRITFRTQES